MISFELLHSLMKKLFFFIHTTDSVRHLFKCKKQERRREP